LSFNGTSAYVAGSSTSAGDNLNNFTTVCWFKTTQTVAENVAYSIFSKIGTGGTSSGNGWVNVLENPESTVTAALTCYIQQDNGNIWLGAQSTVNVNDGAVHCAIIVYANANLASAKCTAYLDGSTANMAAFKFGTWATGGFSNTQAIEAGSDPASEFLAGTVDDCRVYSVALTSSQVATLYASGPQ
jgi:hypothetical protein